MAATCPPVCPAEFRGVLGPEELYIAHFSVADTSAPECLVSDQTLILCDISHALRWKQAWLEVHQVSPEGELKIKVFFEQQKANVKMPIAERLITFQTRKQRDLYLTVMRRLCRDSWQSFFECRSLRYVRA